MQPAAVDAVSVQDTDARCHRESRIIKSRQNGKKTSPRRKYTTECQVHFLEEAVAPRAHLTGHGTQGAAFYSLAANLNKSKGPIWAVHEKDCIEKYRALLKSFKVAERAKANSTGIEEEYGEQETLLHDIISAVKEDITRRETLRKANAAHEKRLLKSGERISRESMAMSALESSYEENDRDGALYLTDIYFMTPRNASKKLSGFRDVGLEEFLALQKKRADFDERKVQVDETALDLEKKRGTRFGTSGE